VLARYIIKWNFSQCRSLLISNITHTQTAAGRGAKLSTPFSRTRPRPRPCPLPSSHFPGIATCNSLEGCAINFARCFAALHKFRRYKDSTSRLPNDFPAFFHPSMVRFSLLRPRFFAQKYVYFVLIPLDVLWSHILCSCLESSSAWPALLACDEQDERQPECWPKPLRATFPTLAPQPLTFEVAAAALLPNCRRVAAVVLCNCTNRRSSRRNMKFQQPFHPKHILAFFATLHFWPGIS